MITRSLERFPDVHREALHAEQNAIEEGLRDEFLQANLFHGHFLPMNLDVEHIEQRRATHDQFMLDKKGKNMGERMELALNLDYLNVIRVVELGHTTQPGDDGHADGLKKDFIDLREWMIANEWIETEMSREESGRTIEFHGSRVAPDRAVAVRNRPLVDTVIKLSVLEDSDPIDVRIMIAKRMVFSIPSKLVLAYDFAAEHEGKEFVMESVEQLLDSQSNLVDPIRTGYYLATELV
jgi:hypothetical protein